MTLLSSKTPLDWPLLWTAPERLGGLPSLTAVLVNLVCDTSSVASPDSSAGSTRFAGGVVGSGPTAGTTRNSITWPVLAGSATGCVSRYCVRSLAGITRSNISCISSGECGIFFLIHQFNSAVDAPVSISAATG